MARQERWPQARRRPEPRGLSQFMLIRNLGLLTSGLVILCFLADVTLLPGLLLGLSAT